MGRKIPAKKHRGVKDPIEQQARRFQSIKGKINAPPKDPDEQPIPRSLTRLFAFQHKDNDRVKKKKKPKPALSSTDNAARSGVGRNPVAHLKKLPGESGRGFSLRINSAIRTLHHPLEQDYPYPQEMEADDVKGERMAAERARRARKRKRTATAAGTAASTAAGAEPASAPLKLSRGQKLTLKKKAKLKALEEVRPEVVYERVSFGDVTHAPPALAAPRRAAPACGAPRPGRRDLLLSSLLAGGGGGGAGGARGGKQGAPPPVELERRERARLAAVAAYRQLKKERQLEHNNRKKNNNKNK